MMGFSVKYFCKFTLLCISMWLSSVIMLSFFLFFFCSSGSLKMFHTERKFENRSLGSEQDEGKLGARLDLTLNMHEGHL